MFSLLQSHTLPTKGKLLLSLQAQPEVLFEGTASEGLPFKVQAAIVDESGFPGDDDFELRFRYIVAHTDAYTHAHARIHAHMHAHSPIQLRSSIQWLCSQANLRMQVQASSSLLHLHQSEATMHVACVQKYKLLPALYHKAGMQ